MYIGITVVEGWELRETLILTRKSSSILDDESGFYFKLFIEVLL